MGKTLQDVLSFRIQGLGVRFQSGVCNLVPSAKRATALRSVCDLVWDGVRVCDQGGGHMTITWSGPGVRPASWGKDLSTRDQM